MTPLAASWHFQSSFNETGRFSWHFPLQTLFIFFYGCVCLPVVDHMAAAPGRDSHQRCRYFFFCFSSFVGMICSDGFNLINFLNVLIGNNGHKTFPNHQAKPTATHYVNQFATEKRVWWIQMAWINLDACSVSRKLETCLKP